MHPCPSRSALRASAVKHDFVILKLEPFGQHRLQLAGTAVDVKHPATPATVEMMVMPDIRQFVTRRFAREVDRLQPTLFDQCLDMAINRRDAE